MNVAEVQGVGFTRGFISSFLVVPMAAFSLSSFAAAAAVAPVACRSGSSRLTPLSFGSTLWRPSFSTRMRATNLELWDLIPDDPFTYKHLEKIILELGSEPPNFKLLEPATGKTWQLKDFQQHQALLVMFTCYNCPFVMFLRSAITKLIHEYIPKGLGAVAIMPNSVKSHPQDGPPTMVEEATKYQYKFPYLYDETQKVVRAYGALGTPDFFLYSKNEEGVFQLAYHGQFDNARPHDTDIPITGSDLRAAIECVLSGTPVSEEQKYSMGCSIKWHPPPPKPEQKGRGFPPFAGAEWDEETRIWY